MKSYLDIDEEKIKKIVVDSEANTISLVSCTEDHYQFPSQDVEIVLPKDVIKIEFNLLTNKKISTYNNQIVEDTIEEVEKSKLEKIVDYLILKFYEKN